MIENYKNLTANISIKKPILLNSMSVNQYLRYHLGRKQKIQVIRRSQVYFSSSNVSTDATVIV